MSLKHDAVPPNPYHGGNQQGIGALTQEYDILVISVQDKDKRGKICGRKQGYQSNLSDQPDEQCTWYDVADNPNSSTGIGSSTVSPACLPGATCTVRARGGTSGQHLEITQVSHKTSPDSDGSGQTYHNSFVDPKDQKVHSDKQGAKGDKTFAHMMPVKEMIKMKPNTMMAEAIRNFKRPDNKQAMNGHKETNEQNRAGGAGKNYPRFRDA